MPRLAALLFGIAVCAGPVLAGEEPDAKGLERLVLQDCGSCHGLTRQGGLGSDLRAETLAHWDPDALAEIILDGIPGTAMPPWRPIMSEAEAYWIAEYLLTPE